ncbi:MAG: CapA family protein [Cyclobacteriaceae bacterium]|nr:CapA family protein [Cyclobacteriaceae bacterium]MCB9238477.1 CapA family protein [Flammeovirgaceae bacterium]MCO5271424.1 CapA family protein [Cyclobacteriaceae bacterium]MCW5903603.1 CapA family protein [Cyclobacteriaceae bacterium]
MRYLFWIVVFTLASCASSRLARQSTGHNKALPETAGDTAVVKLDTVQHPLDTVKVTVGPIIIDTEVHIPPKDTLTFIGVGDIMMGTNYPNTDRLPPHNARELMKEVSHLLRDADITMGNLEGVLLDAGGTPKGCRNPDVCYVFRSPTAFAANLVEAGFDIMGLANNHAGDFGDTGRKSSMKTLDSLGIQYAGLLAQPYVVFEKENVKYGFAAFAPNSGCANINDLVAAKATIAHLDSLADVVIVSFHGGAEGSKYEHVPRQHEIFVGEDRGDVYHFAHAVIDAGADIVFGHGPHVTRAIEVYKNRFIAYSLGNFCTYGGFNLSGVNGWAPIIKVFTDRKGVFHKAKITPVYQTPMSPVRIDLQGRVIKRIRQLTLEDFPEVPIAIDEEGWVRYSTK